MKKICLALSGGVDSSVAAVILKNLKFNVTGFFMKNWENNDNDCSTNKDIQDLNEISKKLCINFNKINFSYEYWNKVFEKFIEGYKNGYTPNPDILCNKEIKFKIFLNYAMHMGYDFIATGHYVRKSFKNGLYQLIKGKDLSKDQSYFLYNINQYQLSKTLFPVGNLLKIQVRKIAFTRGLLNYNKKDSTGICFIGKKNFKDFIKQYIKCTPGKIVDINNNFLGTHEGYPCYTIGQRKGLKIGGIKNKHEFPWFVYAKNVAKNTIVAVQGSNNKMLYSKILFVNKINWISGFPPNYTFTCTSKIRHGFYNDLKCTVKLQSNTTAKVIFDKKFKTTAKEQSVVFYKDDICLGGGIIVEIL